MSGFRCLPFFLDGAHGALFAVHHAPPADRPVQGHVLCVPPFNEEMNRCRSMVTLQARRLAEQGWGTLLLDLHGTGDSSGEFADARWEHWLDDIATARRWLDTQPGGCRALWGIRLGAILAARAHMQAGRADLRLLLWQPVAEGKTHLNQFLRVKIAAQMDRSDLPKETTAGMRAEWAQGRTVEVAGYELHPQLAQAIDTAKLVDCQLAAGSRVLWLENANGDDTDLSPASRLTLQKWPGPDVRIETGVFAGPAFWQVHERVLAPAVIDRSTPWLTGGALP